MADEPTVVPCKDIPRHEVRNETVTLDKVPHQSDYVTFADWARHQANKHCEPGHCIQGNCHGHAEISAWDKTGDTDTTFTVTYSADYTCRCVD
jgi:hypothetical protein